MKLWDLLENSSLLQPGEKKIRDDLSLRRAQDIQNKIHQLLDSLASSESLSSMFQKDQQLQDSLEKLKKRIDLKVSYLQRMQLRTDNGMTRMFAILDRECSEFLAYVTSVRKILYRGIHNDQSVFEGRSRLDRKPKDSFNLMSARFDQALINNGFPARRSNSIFTTTSQNFASNYGSQVYCIFPKNGFHVLTTNQRDLILNDWNILAGDHAFSSSIIDDYLHDLLAWLDTHPPQQYMQDRHAEWVIRVRQVFQRVLNVSDMLGDMDVEFNSGNPMNFPDSFHKPMGELISDQSILNYLEPRSDDLEQAMIKGWEVMINGEYWALKRDDWIGRIRDRYLGGVNPR